MRLEWKQYQDPIFGPAAQIEGFPTNTDDWSASVHRRSIGKFDWFAHAYINGKYMCHNASTMRTAIKRLNAEIARRSIGLFGVDDLEIVGP
jgi:hypothetical protein